MRQENFYREERCNVDSTPLPHPRRKTLLLTRIKSEEDVKVLMQENMVQTKADDPKLTLTTCI